nr:uncharacterized protein CI109_004256 [Kwoniella shandongensis]KAA5527440.1 hypothetical protein CI109_004256 [Kwoniella shandongensis]
MATLLAYHVSASTGTALDLDPVSNDQDHVSDHGGAPGWRGIKVVHAPKSGKTRGSKPHDVVKEVIILRKISHPNVVRLLGYEYDEQRIEHRLFLPLYITTLSDLLADPSFPFPERPESGTKDDASDQLDQSAVVIPTILTYQLLSAISYLHALDPPIAHRDINPSNVMFDIHGDLKLVDFGTAWVKDNRFKQNESSPAGGDGTLGVGGDGMDMRGWNDKEDEWEETYGDMCCDVGTGPYRAPELLFSPTEYDPLALDLWSTGVIMSQLFRPFTVTSTSMSPYRDGMAPEEDDEDEYDPLDHNRDQPPPGSSQARQSGKRQPLFDDTFGSLGLAASVFKVLGTPTKENWPDFDNLPDAGKIEFPTTSPVELSSLLPERDHMGLLAPHILQLIEGLLVLDPRRRIPARQALESPWFDVLRDSRGSGELIFKYRHLMRSWIEQGIRRYERLAERSREE